MKSKLFTLFIALVASVGTLSAWDHERVLIGDWRFNLDEGNLTAEITDCGDWLSSANIPSSVIYDNQTYNVTSIGEIAFGGYSGLTSVTIPNSVTSIGFGAFDGCSGLTSITIPNSVTSIEGATFHGCSGLTSVTIPNSVTSIGETAFEYCTGLTSVTIPNSVTSIGVYAFRGCSGLTSMSVEDGNTVYDNRDNCNAIIETSTNTLIAGCQNTIIPNSVTSIGGYAFSGCSGLTSIDIPNSVTSIGEAAFYQCSNLTSVTIGNSVTSIGGHAFRDCSGLTSVTIGNSVTSIGEYAFYHCSSLTSVTIGNSVTSIGGHAFRDCSGLTSITIPNSVTSIGEYAFRDCSGLTSITIPNSVTSIGNGAFYSCSGLTSVTIGNSVTSIGNNAFYGCSGLTSVIIPNSVTSIGYAAFRDCSGLTSVTIGNSVTSIGTWAFAACSGLTSVTIPNSVTSIGAYAFAFEVCSGLTDIKVKWSTSEALASVSIGSDVFYNVPTSAKLHIPAEAWGCYSASPWNDFTNRVATCNDDVDNTSFFSAQNGNAIDFELGRTLYKDGYYNTICLPFDIDDFEGTPLEGATVKEFVNAEVVDGCLELNVTDAASIEAGKPYLVSFESGEDITDAVFEEVTIATSTAQTIDGGAVDFVGILAPTDLELNNTNMLFLGANNELYWPNTNDPLRGYRAYFAVNSGSSAPVRYGMPARIVEQQNSATAIADNAAASMPEKKLVNGELVISRGSSSYNVLGMTIR